MFFHKKNNDHRTILLISLIILGFVSTYFSISFALDRHNKILINQNKNLAILIKDESDLNKISDQNPNIKFINISKFSDSGDIVFLHRYNFDVKNISDQDNQYYQAISWVLRIGESQIIKTEFNSEEEKTIIVPIYNENKVVSAMSIGLIDRGYSIDTIIYGFLPFALSVLTIILLSFIYRAPSQEREYIDQKEEFISIASHEIRTPLTGIKWASESLLSQKDQNLDESTKSMITLIHENCEGLIERLNELLAVTVFENRGYIEMTAENFKLKDLLQKIVGGLSLTAASRQVSVILDSSIKENVYIHGDREQLRQVLVNLISNAIKYTRENTEVIISYAKEGQNDTISILDHGQGIASEEIGKIFSGYHRTKEAKKSGQYGNGMGLFIAQEIIHAHRGNITVSSALGRGSTFTILLPNYT